MSEALHEPSGAPDEEPPARSEPARRAFVRQAVLALVVAWAVAVALWIWIALPSTQAPRSEALLPRVGLPSTSPAPALSPSSDRRLR